MAAPILVVAGPSGAGKTTAGRTVAATIDPSVLSRSVIGSDHLLATGSGMPP